ncbi:MaoC family dehydratase [Dasania marina]|uniref:MaoC family dehydratase n=1 Tax=Dasania marina TaxID=471499 RepID=UPI0003798BD5|nr:MaoC family dehydratase [Dasania marina]
MQDVRFDDLNTLHSMITDEYGPWSEPVTINQKMIDIFAEMTGDHQWIHTDVERAKQESEFGNTIAHGFLVLGMSTIIKNSTSYRIVDHGNVLNYGLDGVRFVSPVPAGSSLYGRTRLRQVEEAKGGVMLTVGVAIHVVGAERPAVVFDWKLLYRG